MSIIGRAAGKGQERYGNSVFSIQCLIKSKMALKSINMFYKRANPIFQYAVNV